MRKKQILKIETSLDREVLFAANAAVGQLLVALRARSASNRRIRAAEGTAHDKLQVAVAYLCHGGVLLSPVYLSPKSTPMGQVRHPLAFYIHSDILGV